MFKKRTPAELDVDVRFLLANERTLLAWIRTCLALEAGGVALLHFQPETVLGTVIIGVGVITAGIGYARFRAADAAIRSQKLPTPGYGPEIEVIGVTLIAVVLLMANLSA